MKRLFPLVIIMLLPLDLLGQNQVDALRYSQTYSGGTARSVALGGAFGALGGDFYTVSQNPAGLGVFRGSELTFTPELFYSRISARYYSNREDDIKYNFNFNNFGYVTSFDIADKGLISGSFAFGYNKLNNYNENLLIEGNNIQSSLGDMFVESANYGEGNGPVDPQYLLPFTEGLFYDGYIMDLGEDGYYHLNEAIRDSTGNINIDQQNTISRSGRMNEWVLSLGFNYEHVLYFGASFSMIPVQYRENSTFRESSASSGMTFFRYDESLNVTGNGYTGKLGIILKPVHFLRLGLAFHLPVSYYLSEVHDADLQSGLSGSSDIIYPIDEYGDPIDYGQYDYRIVTPAKTIGSLGLIVGKIALLSADVEYINYAGMRLTNASDGYDFSDENSTVKAIYTSNINLKTGAEFRFGNLYLRGGFGYYGSPYKASEPNADAYKLSYSGGLGIRDKNFFVDFALSYLTGEERYVLYDSPFNANPVSAELSSQKVKAMATFGFRF